MTDDLTGARQAAADGFIDAVRRYVTDGPVDLQGPADRLVDALDGHATDADVAAVLNCAGAVVAKYWQHLGYRQDGGQRVVLAITQAHIDMLDKALFVAMNGFDRQRELVAAEQAVLGLEAEAVAARADLEHAVAAGDLEKVLALRGVSEVTLPGRLGEAQGRLLALRVEAARAQLDAAVSVRRRRTDRVAKAEKARDDAAALLQQRVQQVAAEQEDERRAAGNEHAARSRIAAGSAELEEHRRTHHEAQQSRIRQLAGLAPNV